MPGKIEHVSVLMPAYNSAAYIKQSVRSILEQTFRNFELIIIDDGSTDGTEKIISDLKDDRIRYFKIEHKGTSAALNFGVSKCSYQWIARLDSDDLNVPSRLERQIKYIEDNPGTDVLSSWSAYFSDTGKILFLLREPTGHEDIVEYLNLHNPVNQSAMMIKKSLLKENRFSETMENNEDFELMFRLRDKARFHIMPEFLVYTRWRKNSRTFAGDNTNLYEMLYLNAFRKMQDSKSKGVHFIWASRIAWINYFYGRREDARGYFRNSFSFRNLIAYITTFLPDKYFFKFTDSRLKYRLNNIFEKTGKYTEELRKLNRQN
jgi:glycosyltransferase involved in cell wall biosynthesis